MNSFSTQSSCADTNELGSLSAQQALNNMLQAINEKAGDELVPLTEAVDRILAEPIRSTIDVPAHRNSAVDGYAIMQGDLAKADQLSSLLVTGQVVAGHPEHSPLQPGQAIQIMTGAKMPDNADTVIMQEHVERDGQTIRFDARHRAGQNVRQAGEDIQRGEIILAAGIKLSPAQIGLIASLGQAEIRVKAALSVALFSTGDEILNIGEAPREACIYDSNRYSLGAALSKLGCKVLDMGIIPDHPEQLREAFQLAAANADIIFTSGGVSVGEADYTKQILAETGQVDFWKVAIKPGRPIAFGHIDEAVFFGLPGNPVAVMVTFYQFALPCLEKLMGLSQPLLHPNMEVKCSQPIAKRVGRTEIQRGILSQQLDGSWQVKTTGKQGSGILRSMSQANAFIILQHERGPVKAGEYVTVQAFSGLF
ncbi:molybdopterin molybdenumtransferase MoeA [Cycloclasticus sp. 46_120_T64]|nr:molybdopterin molybdenumtransferase MoeA [Cycloclasticus sp. 46_120_T64]